MRSLTIISLCAVTGACSVAPRQPISFSGTWVGNEAESVMLPGQHVPKNMVSVMKDDGLYLQTAQIFKDKEGKEVGRFTWNSRCDGIASPIIGVDPPGVASLSCERINAGALIMTLQDKKGYSHVETCRMSADGRKHTCRGTATLPDGSKHDFVYAFDKQYLRTSRSTRSRVKRAPG